MSVQWSQFASLSVFHPLYPTELNYLGSPMTRKYICLLSFFFRLLFSVLKINKYSPFERKEKEFFPRNSNSNPISVNILVYLAPVLFLGRRICMFQNIMVIMWYVSFHFLLRVQREYFLTVLYVIFIYVILVTARSSVEWES